MQHYRQLAASDSTVLNRKVPRGAFADLLDRMGEMLLTESMKLAESPGPIRTFVDANPLPPAMAQRLPDYFRVFCLALNSLKQWVAAEQSATDRYLLGGAARELCRQAEETCLVTGAVLGQDSELHHPVRDGRPPILLSKKGHALIEDQLASVGDDPIGRRSGHSSAEGAVLASATLRVFRSDWSAGAVAIKGESAAGARVFAKKAATAADVGYEQIFENGWTIKDWDCRWQFCGLLFADGACIRPSLLDVTCQVISYP